MSHGGRAAEALTGLGEGQGRQKSHLLSVWPPTKVYFRQSRTIPEPKEHIINKGDIGKVRYLQVFLKFDICSRK